MSWRLARSLATLVEEIRLEYPDVTIWSIGDEDHRNRASDHNPNLQGVVCAIDVLGREIAQELWDFLLEARDPRMKYDIHDEKILSSTISPWTVRDYDGSNPHADHIHISVGRGRDGSSYRADLYDDPSPWGFAEEDDDMVKDGEELKDVQEDLNFIIENTSWDLGNVLVVDGVWGSKTRGVLDNFRNKWALRSVGRGLPRPADLTKIDRTIHEIKEHDAYS